MKLIAIDMDGTLLNRNGEISSENREAIKYAQANGTEVAIATGRVIYDVKEKIEAAGLNTHIIGTNGATIHAKEGHLVRATPLDDHDLEVIVSWLHDRDYYFEVYTDQSIFSPDNGKERMLSEIDRYKSANPEADVTDYLQMVENHFGQYGFTYFKSYEEIMEAPVKYYKVLAFSLDEMRLKEGWERFEPMQNISIVSSADNNFEIQHREASKGNAVAQLAEELGISLDRTMAIGDNYNDVSMFEAAAFSVAMGNAKDEIKALCRFMTKTNNENGVAHAIHQFIDGKWTI